MDSTAYAIYVFALVRDFLSTAPDIRARYVELLRTIDNAIGEAVGFIARNRNPDNGWGFVRSDIVKLNSRTYSTSMVVASLSYCREKDFTLNGLAKRDLIASGVQYLLEKQVKRNENCGSWSFCEDHDESHPIITSLAIWALSCTYGDYRDTHVESAVDHGTKYILQRWRTEDIYEEVHYPTSTGHKSLEVHHFAMPFHMIVPAVLLSGELGFKDDKVIEAVEEIQNRYQRKDTAI